MQMNYRGGKVTYFRVETTVGWTRLEAKNLREAKTEALILRGRALATTGSRYCLLTKHKDDSKPGFVGTQIGEWKMSNVKASGWTAIYISAVTDKS
jgi:hypothetical protein